MSSISPVLVPAVELSPNAGGETRPTFAERMAMLILEAEGEELEALITEALYQCASWCSMTPSPRASSSPPGRVPEKLPNGWL
jgi:hypothetical protein